MHVSGLDGRGQHYYPYVELVNRRIPRWGTSPLAANEASAAVRSATIKPSHYLIVWTAAEG
jgi:hypothetical protein